MLNCRPYLFINLSMELTFTARHVEFDTQMDHTCTKNIYAQHFIC